MENALDKALANASLNARMNGDTLHTENLDSIADPTFDELPDLPNIRTGEVHTVYNKDGISYVKPSESIPRPVLNYQQMMETEYAEKVAASNTTTSNIHHLSVLTQVISDKTNQIQQQLNDVYVQLSRIEATITSAAQSMSSAPNLKHRSLDQWDDSQLLNELVERENDLMPFYYELLKRIGSPELQKLVMSSMQGKNASMVTLAQLCSALAPQPIQSQPISGNTVLIPNNPAREKQKQAEALLSQNMLSEEQQKALSDEDYYNWATYMNQLCEASTIMMRFPLTRNHEPIKWNHESVDPHPQYFGQATEEYIRQTNKR